MVLSELQSTQTSYHFGRLRIHSFALNALSALQSLIANGYGLATGHRWKESQCPSRISSSASMLIAIARRDLASSRIHGERELPPTTEGTFDILLLETFTVRQYLRLVQPCTSVYVKE